MKIYGIKIIQMIYKNYLNISDYPQDIFEILKGHFPDLKHVKKKVKNQETKILKNEKEENSKLIIKRLNSI